METRLDNEEQYPETLKKLSSALINADGIIIVSPEYKNGMPGVLKNAFDYLSPQIFKHIPLGIVTVSFDSIKLRETVSLLFLFCKCLKAAIADAQANTGKV